MSQPERTVMFQLPSVLSGNLACVEGTVNGRSFDLSAGTFVIGRLDNADLQLPNEPGVSKTHAKIVAEGEHYVLVDCESRNGTIVNGAPIQRKTLVDGDEIRICGCVLRFSQRGHTATGINVRNIDNRASSMDDDGRAPGDTDEGIDVTDPGGDARASGAPPRTLVSEDPFEGQLDPAIAAAVAPSHTRTLVGWYVGGLMSALLFGGSASAVIVARAPRVEQPLVAEAKPAGDAKPGDDAKPAADTPAAADDAPAVAAGAGAAGGGAAEAGAAEAATREAEALALKQAADAKAAEEKAAAERAAAEKAAAEKAAAETLASAAQANAGKRVAQAEPTRRGGGRRRPAAAAAEPTATEPDDTDTDTAASGGAAVGKAFAATPDGGKSETLKTRGGKVKTVEAKDGDAVTKGQVLITFEDGASEREIVSLKDRIASLEAVDSEEAREDLKSARAKLEALMSSGKSSPVVAGMAGTLSGFGASVGDVLRSNATVGRIADGDVPKRVRVQVDRATRPRKGQSVTLVLKGGGEANGTVASVSGRAVVVDCGETGAPDVDAVRF